MEIFACKTCRDFGRVDTGHEAILCPECASWPPEKRRDILREATRRDAEKPSITESDLSDAEKLIFAGWMEAYPNVHRLTLLTWIEGRRYDPEKDEGFLAEARKQFKKWQFFRFTREGRAPEWVENALSTGDISGLSKAERQHIEEMRVTR